MPEVSLVTWTLAQKVGQMVLAELPDPTLDAGGAALLRERHLGGVILFARNLVSAPQTRALTEAIHAACAPAVLPALVATDQEGGRVQRLRDVATVWPTARAVGATGDLALTERVAAAMGRELRALGFTVDFAPVADVHTNPRNPVIGDRAFATQPERVAANVVAAVRGLMAAGVAPAAKHFPGHGDTFQDSHLTLPTLPHDMARLRRVELVPFVAAIGAEVPLVMTTHIRFPAVEPGGLPATLSRRILTDLLRDELGYGGVIVTDAMEMQAIADNYGIVEGSLMSVLAGADLVMPLGGQTEAVLDALIAAVATGRLPEAAVDASVRRILRLKGWLAIQPPQPLAVVGSPEHRALAQEVTRRGGP